MNSFPVVEDLYTREGLARVDARFLAQLEAASPDLHHRLLAARRDPDAFRATSRVRS